MRAFENDSLSHYGYRKIIPVALGVASLIGVTLRVFGAKPSVYGSDNLQRWTELTDHDFMTRNVLDNSGITAVEGVSEPLTA